jgi:hypothetical protein
MANVTGSPVSMASLGAQEGAKNYLSVTNQVFQAFTGADMNASINYIDQSGISRSRVFGSLNTLTVSVVRDVNPLWAMGSPDYRAITKGKRAISGTMTFTVFDRDPIMRDIYNAGTGTLETMWKNLKQVLGKIYSSGVYSDGAMFVADTSVQNSLAFPGLTNLTSAVKSAQNLRSLVGSQPLRYADQIPPFDVTISMANESGFASSAALRFITIVSQATGWSMNEQESDQVYQYIARYYEPLTPVADSVPDPQEQEVGALWEANRSSGNG